MYEYLNCSSKGWTPYNKCFEVFRVHCEYKLHTIIFKSFFSIDKKKRPFLAK